LAIAACFSNTSAPFEVLETEMALVATYVSETVTPIVSPQTESALPSPTALSADSLATTVESISKNAGITTSNEISSSVSAEMLSELLTLATTRAITPTLAITQSVAQTITNERLVVTSLSQTASFSSTVIDDDALILVPTPTPETAVTRSPEPTPDGTFRSVRLPILMYHYLSEPPADADIYRKDLSVTPQLFGEHLDRMKAEGYTTLTLYDLLDHLTEGVPLPEKAVILTFDDGYRDNYENALPALAERDMTATFFVVTDFVDEERPEYLTWAMLREMHNAGMSIEAHGRNHVSLQNKDIDYLVWQALGSYEAIEREIGQRPRFISYPAGEYDRQAMDLFKSANYWAGLTTIQGATHDSDNLFELRRVRIRGTTTPDEIIRLLELDW
jgi:peptidoglycan/xylan/chitin deacetylase (PgdA/CDA1 family)